MLTTRQTAPDNMLTDSGQATFGQFQRAQQERLAASDTPTDSGQAILRQFQRGRQERLAVGDTPTDSGQATLLMILVLFLTVGVAVVVSEVGRLINDSAQARTAADAAALAGAAEGEKAAAELAAANGGVLVSYNEHRGIDVDFDAVTVTVRVGRAAQSASASAVIEWIPPG